MPYRAICPIPFENNASAYLRPTNAHGKVRPCGRPSSYPVCAFECPYRSTLLDLAIQPQFPGAHGSPRHRRERVPARNPPSIREASGCRLGRHRRGARQVCSAAPTAFSLFCAQIEPNRCPGRRPRGRLTIHCAPPQLFFGVALPINPDRMFSRKCVPLAPLAVQFCGTARLSQAKNPAPSTSRNSKARFY